MTETQSSPPPPGAEAPGLDRENLRSYQRLTRSTTDRKVAGVAGGLGRHLNVDPTILRVLFVVLCFFGGAGFLLYGVAWLLVPEDGQAEGKISMSPNTRNGFLIAAGIIAACILLGNSWNGFGFPWPVFLVGIAVVVYLMVRDDRPTPPPSTYQPVYGPPTAGQATGTTYAPGGRRWRPAPTRAAVAGTLAAGAGVPAAASQARHPAVRSDARADRDRARCAGSVRRRRWSRRRCRVRRTRPRRGRRDAGGRRVRRTTRRTDLPRHRRGLRARRHVGRRQRPRHELQPRRPRPSVAPTSAAGVLPRYDITSGRITVDLSRVRDPEALDGRTIDIDGRAGEVVVVLPRGIESKVSAEIHGPGADRPARPQLRRHQHGSVRVVRRAARRP